MDNTHRVNIYIFRWISQQKIKCLANSKFYCNLNILISVIHENLNKKMSNFFLNWGLLYYCKILTIRGGRLKWTCKKSQKYKKSYIIFFMQTLCKMDSPFPPYQRYLYTIYSPNLKYSKSTVLLYIIRASELEIRTCCYFYLFRLWFFASGHYKQLSPSQFLKVELH